MATKTMLIAVAVVAVVLVASGVYLATRDNGGEGGSQVDAIGMDVSVGDYYTITSSQSASQPSPMTLAATVGSDQTKYTVTAIDENTGMIDVSVETPNGTSHETMAKEDFLDDVTVVDQAYIGEYQRNDTIAYAGKNVQCMVFMDQQDVGGATTVTTYDYIGVDSNVIYQTEIVIVSNNTTNTYRTTLTDTNMIGKESSTEVIVPEGSIQTGEIRTQLQVGDYIEFSKYDHDDRDIEGAVVVRIDGNTLYYRELGDDDVERTPVDDFLSLIRNYQGIKELDATIINALIDKILVSEREKLTDGMVRQEIKIYYKFIGFVDELHIIPTKRWAAMPAKNCTVCGVEYVPGSGASRYCPACAKKIRREKSNESKRRSREQKRIACMNCPQKMTD